MKEFIEKLIGRLEELYDRIDKSKKEAYEEKDWERFDLFTHRNEGVYGAIAIVNQLAEEYAKDINVSTIDAGELLGNGWIPCSERLPEEWEYYLVSDGQSTFIAEYADYEWRYHSNEQTKDYVTVSVLAWQPLPAPYQPKGEQT